MKKINLKDLRDTSYLANGGTYLEEQLERYLNNDPAVSPQWQQDLAENQNNVNLTAVKQRIIAAAKAHKTTHETSGTPNQNTASSAKQLAVAELINAYRVRGHEYANIDPLNYRPKVTVRELDPAAYQLNEEDMNTTFSSSFFGTSKATLNELLKRLKRTYCGSIGYEFMHILDTTQKEWIQRKIESIESSPSLSIERRQWLLDRLIAAESLERYLHTKYTGQKRFSLEGGESLIASLATLVEEAGHAQFNELVFGMAHRGRLNVLVNLFGKKPAELFSEFEGSISTTLKAGDVKYHQGFSSDVKTEHGSMHLSLAFNPSHLEIVSPVVEGSSRARQDRCNDEAGDQVLPITIHGDAAFAGQGVVMETLNMADIRGYTTRGTIHIVINNQIGFTTSNPIDSRSTPYCTDIAKIINIPILHVNSDDPEAVYFATKLAFEFRQTFKRDVVIDLVCYRRHGHNEADEPNATQPRMYSIIKKLPTTQTLYANKLVQQTIISDDYPKKRTQHYRNALDVGECIAPNIIDDDTFISKNAIDWHAYIEQNNAEVSTSLPTMLLQQLGKKMATYPENFTPHRQVAKIYADRILISEGKKPLDWGFAEMLAYASLLHEGYPIRISGQDSRRGTFFHRHAALHDINNGEVYLPLEHMSKGQPSVTIIDSFLSEEAVLAFEYGYATTRPDTLTIWEAQFGDFANGAQVVIDQFISSGEVKWGRLSGLVLYLPHGYEGQGPEHSSARPERFLQLCANENIQVLAPTTPAQVFHMIRRQMLRRARKPLVVMTGKSLLRNPQAISSLEDLSQGSFQTVIDDTRKNIDTSKVKRIVLCSGKIYYELLKTCEKESIDNVALIRLEQIYPFPYNRLQTFLKQYTAATDIVWCQEEPKNQGAWRAIRHRVERVITKKQTLLYRGAHSSASPAPGYIKVHNQQQETLIHSALGLKEWVDLPRPDITI